MALILNIETSTRNCSVAVAEGGKVLALIEESSDQYVHSEKLHLFIERCISEAGKQLSDLEAVAVGKGPGSYTGLRIGVSAAKGFCFALNIPLISTDGLSIMVRDFLQDNEVVEGEVMMPMIDARRMEVYSAEYDFSGKPLNDIEAIIVEEGTELAPQASKVHLFGDGSDKCKEVLSTDRYVFHELTFPSAKALILIAEEKFAASDFEDVAYFEPFYLKDFIAGKPKKLL